MLTPHLWRVRPPAIDLAFFIEFQLNIHLDWLVVVTHDAGSPFGPLRPVHIGAIAKFVRDIVREN